MIQLLLVIISFILLYCMLLSCMAIITLPPGINPLAGNNNNNNNNNNILVLSTASCHSGDM